MRHTRAGGCPEEVSAQEQFLDAEIVLAAELI